MKIIFIVFGLMILGACEVKQAENVNQNQSVNSTANSNSVNTNTNQTEKKEVHEHSAPHNGTLISFGEEFAHLEIVIDSEKGEIKAYTLDGEAEKSVQISQENIEIEIEKPSKLNIKLEAVANSLTGEKRGATSEFRATNEELKQLKEFDGKIHSLTIRGKEFKDVHFNFPKGNEENYSSKPEMIHNH